MASKFSKELTELIKKYGLSRDDVWDCHGTMVMLHRACEKVAIKIGVSFDEPKVLFTSDDGKSIALSVLGRMSDETAWSIGEASPANNKNAYPWAMAEKRAKDRVILKLARFNECGVYSDIEADDFKRDGATRKAKNTHIADDSRPHYSEDVNNALDPEQVANTVINYFGGDKASARDFVIDAGFPIPSECDASELRGILDALKALDKKKA